jgi:hypothetical protein
VITFADIEPGAALGECAFAFTEEAASEWTSLFPDDAECLPTMPPAMVAMVVMRAFVTLNRRLQPLRCLHDCSGCFPLERLPGGICTH